MRDWDITFPCPQPIVYWRVIAGEKSNRIQNIPKVIRSSRKNLKKLPEILETACLKNEQNLPLRLMFQDEARFGRMSDPRACWAPAPQRPMVNLVLVIVDEVGYTPIGGEECNLFFRFIANRYEKASTIITSNKAFSDWTELFHDPVLSQHSWIVCCTTAWSSTSGETATDFVEKSERRVWK